MVGGVAAVAHHSGRQSAQQQQADQQGAAEPAPPAAAPAAPAEDPVQKLNELKGLLDSGVLTQEEFDAQKSKILAQGL
jgi:membrane protease subunit (stomatin/prohibitin family)